MDRPEVDAIISIPLALREEIRTGNLKSVNCLEDLAQIIVDKINSDRIPTNLGVTQIFLSHTKIDNMFRAVFDELKALEQRTRIPGAKIESYIRVRIEL